MKDFLQEYLARHYELVYYQNEYKKLISSLDPIITPFIDDANSLVKLVSGVEQTHLVKRNSNIYVLFASKLNSETLIQLRESFLGEIYTSFLNRQSVRIFHAGMNIFSPADGPLQIGSIGLFNEVKQNKLIDLLIKYYNSLQVRDVLLDRSLCYSIFDLLNKANRDKPISLFFDKFGHEILADISRSSYEALKVAQNEGKIIEYKSRDYIVGKNEEIPEKIASDLRKKLKDSNFKVYFFGVDEQTQELEPLSSKKFSSDRIGSIEKRIMKEIKEDISELSLVKLPLENDCLILMFATSNRN